MDELERVRAYLAGAGIAVDLSVLEPLRGLYRKESHPARAAIFREGEPYRKVAFILEGLVKKSYRTGEGKEFIKEFAWEGQVTTPYASLLRGIPATYTLEALEDTTLLTIDYAVIERRFREDPQWLAIGKALADLHFLNREEREMELLKHSAPGRYAIFRQRFPHLLGRLRKQDIASYLGITPESLSRLEAKKAGV